MSMRDTINRDVLGATQKCFDALCKEASKLIKEGADQKHMVVACLPDRVELRYDGLVVATATIKAVVDWPEDWTRVCK